MSSVNQGAINVRGDNYRWNVISEEGETLFKAQSAEMPPWKIVVHIHPDLHSNFDASKTKKEKAKHVITPVIASDFINQAIEQGWRRKPSPIFFDTSETGTISVITK